MTAATVSDLRARLERAKARLAEAKAAAPAKLPAFTVDSDVFDAAQWVLACELDLREALNSRIAIDAVWRRAVRNGKRRSVLVDLNQRSVTNKVWRRALRAGAK